MKSAAAIAVTLAVAAAGSAAGKRLRLPAGILLGAIFAVAVYNLCTDMAAAPVQIKILSQGLVGAQIGSTVRRSDLKRLRFYFRPMVYLILALLGYCLLAGALLSFTAPLDLATAVCALAPCSIADMSLLCTEIGGNVAAVASVQTMRLVCILVAVPFVAGRFRKGRAAPAESAGPAGKQTGGPTAENTRKNLLLTLSVGLSASLLGYLLHIPAGTLTFSMAAVTAYALCTGKAWIPPRFRRFAQLLSGMLVGSYVAREDLLRLAGSLPSIFCALLGFVVLNLFLARLFSRKGHMSFMTALFSTAPGGMSDMGLLAAEMGGDLMTVAFFQQSRFIGVMLLYPPVIRLLSRLLSVAA